MRLNKLDLNLLVVLNVLLQEQSTTAAGHRLNISQSAVSGCLTRLRDHFGDELLVHVGRKLIPTSLGMTLAEPVREVLLQIQSTIQLRADFDPAKARRHFSMMMSDYAAAVLMPGLLPKVEQLAPQVSLELHSLEIDTPMEPLERGDVDFQIVPDHLVLRQHPHELLFSDDFVCVIWTGNRLVGEQLSMSQYLSLGHVALSFPRRHHGDDEWVKSMAHVDRRIDIIAINFASLPQYVVGTQRIATVQRRLAALYARHFPVRFLAAPFEIPRLNEMLQWNQNFDADPSHRWFRGILKDVAAEIGTG